MNFQELDDLFDELWPLARSITGPAIQESLAILARHIPLQTKKVKTGTKVFDWQVPPEWKLNSASLYTEDGQKILTSDDNNVHALNFSMPHSGLVDFAELDQHLYSDPANPDAIPYVTSYYARRWGFCLTHKQRQTLPKDIKYRVEIDTEIYDGHLCYGDLTLKGQSEDTVLLSTYLCHPSLANNELSGPLAMAALYHRLAARQDRYYSYRFVVVPETIGSISFLATTPKAALDKIKAGIVLTCLGGPSKHVSFKHSRRHWLGQDSQIDNLVTSFCKLDQDLFCQRDFTPTGGSDERQYCSPGINLPIIQAARTIYGDYAEYHTSLDNKALMTIEAVLDSVEKLDLFLKAFDANRSPLHSAVKGGEPMLGKRNLYPTINAPQSQQNAAGKGLDQRGQLNLLLEVISLIDGTRSVQDIAEFLDAPYAHLIPTLDKLITQKLISHKS